MQPHTILIENVCVLVDQPSGTFDEIIPRHSNTSLEDVWIVFVVSYVPIIVLCNCFMFRFIGESFW